MIKRLVEAARRCGRGAFFADYGWVTALLMLAGMLASAQASAADVMRGRDVYGTHCAQCHGARGMAVMPGAPSFARGESLLKPDVLLLNQIRAGRNVMPGYQGILSDRDILSVIAFLRTLQ